MKLQICISPVGLLIKQFLLMIKSPLYKVQSLLSLGIKYVLELLYNGIYYLSSMDDHSGYYPLHSSMS